MLCMFIAIVAYCNYLQVTSVPGTLVIACLYIHNTWHSVVNLHANV